MIECFIALIKLYLIIIRLDCIWKPMFIKKNTMQYEYKLHMYIYICACYYMYIYIYVYMQAVTTF